MKNAVVDNNILGQPPSVFGVTSILKEKKAHSRAHKKRQRIQKQVQFAYLIDDNFDFTSTTSSIIIF